MTGRRNPSEAGQAPDRDTLTKRVVSLFGPRSSARPKRAGSRKPTEGRPLPAHPAAGAAAVLEPAEPRLILDPASRSWPQNLHWFFPIGTGLTIGGRGSDVEFARLWGVQAEVRQLAEDTWEIVRCGQCLLLVDGEPVWRRTLSPGMRIGVGAAQFVYSRPASEAPRSGASRVRAGHLALVVDPGPRHDSTREGR